MSLERKLLTEYMRRNKELEEENKALRKKVAYLSQILATWLIEIRSYVNVDVLDEVLIQQTAQNYEQYVDDKQMDQERLEKISVSVFLPLAYQYMQEKHDAIKYDAFLEWIRKRHPTIYRVYAKETITRSLRKLRELGYLVSPKKPRGVFLVSELGIKKLEEITSKKE